MTSRVSCSLGVGEQAGGREDPAAGSLVFSSAQRRQDDVNIDVKFLDSDKVVN